ncbi:AI-2E family transporter [Microlunatus soli]|uniref:Predicted PurR-regulated permease PerM n=1 Tax=Microlunatus soli TaxID=630515 RepID=A0A1H1NEQ8_9ACTN|nr:AI-2E family transporter [Microlunatus soli]SDR96899.1 Predicted PurR-regulated permease PerM [Microlunatus soli]
MASEDRSTGQEVPRTVRDLLPRRFLVAVAWVLGLAVLGGGVRLLLWLLDQLAVVIVPCAVALLFVALLAPLDQLFRRRLPRSLSAGLTVLILLAVLGGVSTLAGSGIASRSGRLVAQFRLSLTDIRHRLLTGPLPIDQHALDWLQHRVTRSLQSAGSGTASAALGITEGTAHLVAGVLLALFVVLFLLHDGDRVWNWFVELFPQRASDRVREAGRAAWVALTGFIQGTFVIACIHALVIGTALWLLGVPIVLPLAILVFVGSFIPVVGAFVAGAVAVVITLGTAGLGAAVPLLVILVVENEIEAHLLQPFVVGRFVRLHPLAIIVVLALGTFVAGFAGALFVVPLTGVLRAVWGPLNGRPSVVPVGRPSRLSRLWQWFRRRAGSAASR